MEIVFVAIVVLIIALAVYGYRAAKKRREELAAWAAKHGFRFSPDHDSTFEERFADFRCLRQGSDRYAYNITTGVHSARPFQAFDYHYETYSTNSKGQRTTHHHYFSAVVVEAGLPLKPLTVRAEGFFDKFLEFVGFDDIDFESAEFSRRFHVKAPERRWAFDVLHQGAMEFLLESPQFTIEFQPGRIIAYRGRTFQTGDFEAAIHVVNGLLDRLPASVVRELKERG